MSLIFFLIDFFFCLLTIILGMFPIGTYLAFSFFDGMDFEYLLMNVLE